MDARAQVGQMSQETRQAFAHRIRSRLSPVDLPAADHDVSIVGGGVAALTLALEIRRARPTTRILIDRAERRTPSPRSPTRSASRPSRCPRTTCATVSGLADHLRHLALRKMGLRMFFSHDGNTDIARRMELGSSSFVPQVTYQIDRGRLENELHRRCLPHGVDIARGRVRSVDIRCRRRSAHDSYPERRRGHSHDGALGGRRVGPQPDAAPATGSQAGQRAPLQCRMVPRRD